MKIRQISKLCAWSLGIFLLCVLPANAQKISSPLQQQSYTRQQVLQQLAIAKVIYLGETHDSQKDHQAQLEIIQELHRQNPKVAIAMEMFQRPYQGAIDQYLAGKLTEIQLIEQTEYNRRWGFPWENYAPILRFAKANQLPVIALNTPTEVTRKVAREGLENLTPDELQHIPHRSDIRTDNAEYRQMALDFFKQHQQVGHGSSANFDNFFLAQVLWDETMAEGIVKFLIANPDYQVVVLAGQAHIIYGYGIPSRVARRMGSDSFIQSLILLNPDPDFQSTTERAIADYFWVTSD